MLCRIRNTLENLNILEFKIILLIGLFVVNYGPNSYLLRTFNYSSDRENDQKLSKLDDFAQGITAHGTRFSPKVFILEADVIVMFFFSLCFFFCYVFVMFSLCFRYVFFFLVCVFLRMTLALRHQVGRCGQCLGHLKHKFSFEIWFELENRVSIKIISYFDRQTVYQTEIHFQG